MAETKGNASLLSQYTPADEALHEPAETPQYSESAYFNFIADESDEIVGGTMRIGLRPTDGYAELSLLLARSAGGFVFRYERHGLTVADVLTGARTLRAGEMSFTAVEPGQAWDVTYASEATRLISDPAAFVRAPGETWRQSLPVRLGLDFKWRASHPAHMMLPNGQLLPGDYGAAHGKHHYGQFGHVEGKLTLDGRRQELRAASSFRDRTWGPRDWDFGEVDGVVAFFGEGSRIAAKSMHASAASPGAGLGIVWRADAVDVDAVTRFEPVSDGGESTRYDLRIETAAYELPLAARVVAAMPVRVGAHSRLTQVLLELDGPLGLGRAWMDLSRSARG